MKILVADDEILVRIGLRTVLEGCGRGYEVIEAADGADALRKFQEHHPTLSIVDINMPAMDGMQFIERARQMDSAAHFVVLTCYSDFPLVRKGIQLAVKDYIIKTSLKDEELLALAAQAEGGLAGGAQGMPAERAASPAEAELRRASSGMEFERQTVSDYLARQGLGPTFHVVTVAARPAQRSGADARTLLSGVRSVLQALLQEYGQGLVLEDGDNRFLLLLSFRTDNGSDRGRDLMEEFGTRLLKCFETYFSRAFVLSVFPGATVRTLGEAIAGAREAQRLGYYDTGPGLYVWSRRGSEPLPDALLSGMRSSVIEALNAGEYTRVSPILEEFMLAVRSRRTTRIDPIAACLCEVFFSLKQHVELHFGQRSAEILDASPDYSDFYSTCDFQTGVRALQRISERLQALIRDDRAGTFEGLIARAKEYIDRNLGNQLCLDAVAEHLNMSSSHFSKVFKHLTGTTFVSYCIERRIRKAKAYINEGNKVFVAAERVGYSNYSYFSKLFKKVTGQTPEDYRRQVGVRPGPAPAAEERRARAQPGGAAGEARGSGYSLPADAPPRRIRP